MEEIIKYAGYVLTAIIGWFVQILYHNQKELRDKMEKHELNVAENYTKRTDFRDMVDSFDQKIKETTQPLYKKLDRIEDILLNRPHMPRHGDD